MSRHATVTALLFTAVAAAFGLLAAVLMPAGPAQAVQERPAAAAAAEAQAPAAAPDPFLVALMGPGTGIPANAEELLAAADRVCGGIAAEVPVMVMADALTVELSLTDEEARHFVNTAATVRCTPAAV